jgi:hypothetical protein
MSFFLKIMGLVDVLAVVVILIGHILPQKMIIYSAGYLIAKGGFFAMTGNLMSILDVVCGVFIIMLAFGISFKVTNSFMVFFLVQKAFFSFV